jgi:hypothetical protein
MKFFKGINRLIKNYISRNIDSPTLGLKAFEPETNRISAIGNPTLSTSVVVPGGLPRANPVSAMPKSIQKDKTE